MRLELYIADLLFRHDCIIVPHLGAFIGRTKSSEIGSATHLFRPPFKEVGFNASLKENDGLLAGYVASLNSVSYNQAEAWIASEVSNWTQRLNQGDKLHLNQIGKLYYNATGKLQFQPSLEQNFSSDAFGLGIFHVPSLQTSTLNVETRSTASSKHIVEKKSSAVLQEPIPIAGKQNLFSWKRAAIWLPIAGILSLGIANNAFLGDAYRSYSSLGPLVFSQAKISPTLESNLLPISGLDGMKTKSVVPFGGGVLSSSSIETSQDQPMETPILSPSNKSSVRTSMSKAAEVKLSPSSSSFTEEKISADVNANRFYIIVGSFGEEKNSSKLIEQLRLKGHNAKVAPGNGLLRVSIDDYATRAEAESAIAQIKNSVQTAAWVYSPK